MAKSEETSELPHDPVMANLIVAETVRVGQLHRELAHHYHAKRPNRARIETLWTLIDGIERFLRANGVRL